MSVGTSSIQTVKSGDLKTHLTKAWATLFPCQWTWAKLQQLKKEAKNLTSWIKCPCNARDGFELVSSLKIMSKSHLKVVEVILISKANSTAFLVANASTYANIAGRGISISFDLP